jgi:hypothetical protein
MEVRFWKVPIGRVRRRTSRKRRSISSVVRTAFALLEGRVTKAGQQGVEVGAQAGDGLRIGALEAIGEVTRKAALGRRTNPLRGRGCMRDGVLGGWRP